MRNLFLAILIVVTAAVPAYAERRVALVIGNSDYVHAGRLENPRNDATDMAAKLGILGFDVVSGLDLGRDAMERRLRDFFGRIKGADIALLFYAGHGLQVAGENYLLPVDTKLQSEDELPLETTPLETVLAAMQRNAKVSIVLLDACRDNPLAKNLARSMGTRSSALQTGLAKPEAGVGSFIAFATQPGAVALDGSGRNSPFTAGLLAHLGKPGRGITEDMTLVRRDVLSATGGDQVPWDSSSLTGPVVLSPASSSPADTPEAGGRDAEIEFWRSIESSKEKRSFEAYLKRYPEGVFADLARLRIDEIGKAEQQVAAAAAPRPEPVLPRDGASMDVATSKADAAGPKRIATKGYNGPTYVEGEFVRVAPGRWEERNSENKENVMTFETREQNGKRIVMFDESRKLWLRFDLANRRLSWRQDGSKNWNRLYDIVSAK